MKTTSRDALTMRSKRRRALRAGLLCLGFMAAGSGAADEIAVKGREVFAKHKSAVVTVELVLKRQFTLFGNSQEEESKSEVTGTMIEPTGLTVVSLTSIDPTSILTDALAGEAGMGLMFKTETQVISAKILLEDGADLPARVVLRDPDLDLAFVQPNEKPAEPLPYVNLRDATEPEILDHVVTLNRLGKRAQRTHGISTGRVEAVVTKPRTFYVPTQSLSAALSLGCPVFALDGKVVGLAVVRKGGKVEVTSFNDIVLAIVLPASDILEAAAQAPSFEEVQAEAKTETR